MIDFNLLGEKINSLVPDLNQQFFWDLYGDIDLGYNITVIGKGVGKSLFMQELASLFRGFGGKIYLIDDGRSYKDFSRIQGGEFIEFSDKSDICLNPFSIIDDSNMDPIYKVDNIGMLAFLISNICKTKKGASISLAQHNYITGVISDVLVKYGSNSSISIIADRLKSHNNPEARDIAILLQPFTKEGIYGHYFEGKINLNFNNPFMVFEFAELRNKKELSLALRMTLMLLIGRYMRSESLSCFTQDYGAMIYKLEGGMNRIPAREELWQFMVNTKMRLIYDRF